MNNVKRARKKKNWNQAHLAAATKISRSTVQRIERGKVTPTAETAMALASVLDLDAKEVQAWSEIRDRLNALMDQWERESRSPTSEELAMVPAMLRPLYEDFHRRKERCLARDAEMRALSEQASRLGDECRELSEQSQRDYRAIPDTDPPDIRRAKVEAVLALGERRRVKDEERAAVWALIFQKIAEMGADSLPDRRAAYRLDYALLSFTDAG
jgi:transcriptional regulator with XRE-family HTH domain